MRNKRFNELVPGDCLGDGHYINRGLNTIINEHLAGGDKVEIKSAICIPGQLHEALDMMIAANTGKPGWRGTNKMIYVVAHKMNSPGVVVGWSYDNNYLHFATVVQDK